MVVKDRVSRGRPRGGATYPRSGRTGKLSITMAPATRFHQWKRANLWSHINAALNEWDRKESGRIPLPSAMCVDSQSRDAGAVKLHPMIGQHRGFNPYKCINGRKRQLLVDTQGRIWIVGVHTAQQGDGPAAVELIGDLLWRVGERVEKVFGDQAYNGVFARELAQWSIDRSGNPV